MKIGIIGAGDVGGTLGKSWRQRKHDIMFGVRNLQSHNVQRLAQMDKSLTFGNINDAVAFGDVILLPSLGLRLRKPYVDGTCQVR